MKAWLVALIIVAIIAGAGATRRARADTVTADPTTADCGTVAVGSSGSATTELTNTDLPTTVDIVGVDSGCPAFSFSPTPVLLTTDLATAIAIAFAPTAPATLGAVSCTVDVVLDGSDAVLGSFTATATVIGGELSAPASVDFGDARFGTMSTTSQLVTVSNPGDGELDITGLEVTGANAGDFSVQTTTPIDIAAGGSAQIEMTFAPSASGTRTATLVITDDSAAAPTTDVALSGVGTNATIDVTSLLDFGTVADTPDSTTATSAIEIDNDGPDPAGPLHVTTVTLADTSGWFDFAASTGCQGQTTCTLDATISEATPLDLAVTCTPTADSTDTNTASVTFTSDSDSLGGNVTELSCTGGAAQLAASTTTLGFGAVAVGATSALPVTLSNTGTSTLTYSLAISGAQAGAFSFTSGCTSSCTIAAGGSDTVDVQFAPVLPPGDAAATIAIATNSPTGPTQIALSGTGDAAVLSPSPTTVAIGGVDVGGAGSATLTIANTGNVDLQISTAGLAASSSAALAVTAGSPGPLTISAGTSAQWTLTCAPTASGSANGVFAVASNASGDAAANIPVTCTGLQGVLQVSSSTVEFGGVRIGDTAPPQSIVLTNIGNATLTSLSQALADTTLGYSITTTLPSALAAGSATTVTFEFTPGSAGQGGSDVATFQASSGTAPASAVTATVDVDGQALQADYDVDPSTLSFGDVLWDGSAQLAFSIIQTDDPKITIETLAIAPDPTTNTQTGEFTVTAVTHDGSALPLPFQPFQLQTEGDTLVVTVTVAPANRTGAMAATLTVHSDLGSNPDREVAMTATATSPTLSVSPGATVSFGEVDLEAGSASQAITLTNTGDGPLGIGAIVGSGSPRYTFALPAPGPLAAGSAAVIGVTYTPTLEEIDTATLTVSLTNLFDDTPTTQTIAITGQGIDRHIKVAGALTFPDTFAYPDTPAVMALAIQDTGLATLNLSMVTSTAQYSVVNAGTSFAVAGGTTLQLMVAFSPTVIGPANGTLTIVDNDRQIPMAVVALNGTGIDRDVAIGPPMINLGATGLGVSVHLGALSAGGLQVVNMDTVHAFTVAKIDFVTTAGAADAFSLTDPPSNQPLAAGATDSYDLVFDPSIEGEYAAAIDLYLDSDPLPRATTVVGEGVFVDARGGGGCNAGGGGAGGAGGAGGLAALLALGAVVRRKRRTAVLAVVLAGAATAATATATADSTRDLDLSVFDPTPATTGTGIQLQAPTVGGNGEYAIWALVSYARKPLELATDADDFAIENRTMYDLGAAFAFLDRFEVGARMPLYTQDGEGVTSGAGYMEPPATGTARGDLTVHGKVELWRGDALALGVTAAAVLPTATSQQFAGVASPEARLLALASYAVIPQLTVQANAGAVLRSSTTFENVDEKSGAMWGVGASYRAIDELWVDAEVFGEAVPSGLRQQPPAGMSTSATSTLSTIEGLAGVRYQLADHTQVTLAVGRGLDDGIGSPAFRGVFGVTYVPGAPRVAPIHPPPPPEADGDADGDGIPDSVDKCPNEPEDKDMFQDQDGCPDPDNDGDGIPDVVDKCPLDPEDFDGFEDADGCPDPDNDHDGIPDVLDKCPNVPEDKDGFEDLDGCPDPDNDHDGIPDKDDKCPNDPETINGFQDQDGCPDVGPDPLVVVSTDHFDLFDTVRFVGSKLSSRSVNLLNQVASTMKAHAEIVKVRIGVHVQPAGHPDQELALTTARAETVREYLIAKGVWAGELEAEGFGGTKPMMAAGRKGAAALNERVELVIVERGKKL